MVLLRTRYRYEPGAFSNTILEATRFKSILCLLSLEISIVRSLTTQKSDLGFSAACWLVTNCVVQ